MIRPTPAKATLALACAALLAGCVETRTTTVTVLTPAEQACMNAVRAETGNDMVSVGSTRPVAGGTEVIVAVGPQEAAWECIAYDAGGTSRPMSLTNEGYL